MTPVDLDRLEQVFQAHGATDVLYYTSERGILNVFYHKKEIDNMTSLRHSVDALGGETVVCWCFESIDDEDTIERIEEVSTQLVS